MPWVLAVVALLLIVALALVVAGKLPPVPQPTERGLSAQLPARPTAAEVTTDCVEGPQRLVDQLGGFFCDKLMADPVKTILANSYFLPQGLWESVSLGMLGYCCVKCGVEHGNLW